MRPHREACARAGIDGVTASLSRSRFAFARIRAAACAASTLFIACIALGVFAIAGVGSISASLSDGLRARRASCSAATPPSRYSSARRRAGTGLPRNRARSRAVATPRAWRAPPTTISPLIDIKAVDNPHPLLGELLDPAASFGHISQRGGTFGAAVDPVLLARFNLKVGDKVSVGQTKFRDSLKASAPNRDKLLGGITMGRVSSSASMP